MKINTSPDLRVSFHGCCIRFTPPPAGSGLPRIPAIHENESHACVGIDNIALNTDGELVVTLQKNADGTPKHIISMNVGFDETMSQLGWDAGLTSGVGAAIVRFSKDGVVKRADHINLYGTYNNIWLQFWTIAEDDLPII